MKPIKPCANSICIACIDGACDKSIEILDDRVCELGQADKMIAHHRTSASIPVHQLKHFLSYKDRSGFVTLQSGELVYL